MFSNKDKNYKFYVVSYLIVASLILLLPRVLNVLYISFENVEVKKGNEFVSIRLPYKANAKADNPQTYEFRASFGSVSFSSALIIPDGCITRIVVNEEKVSLSHISKEKLCDHRRGFVYNFRPYYKTANNNIVIQVQNKGDFYGLELRPVYGAVYSILNGMKIFLVFAFLYLISKNIGVRYSIVLLPFIVAYGYAVLRFKMNIEFAGATWDQLYDLTAQKPYGHRILVPLMSRPLVRFGGASVRDAYMFYEFFFSLLTIAVLNGTFRLYLDKKFSYFASILFVLFVTLPYLLKYKWPIFYPYDMASIFFMISGFYFIMKQKWLVLMIVMTLGSLNRETIILLIPMFVFLKMDKMTLKKQVVVVATLAAIFICIKLIVSTELTSNVGDSARFYIGKKLRVLNNIEWILDKPVNNSIQFLASICYIPLLWIISRRFMPHAFKRLEVWSILFFAPLFVLGNVYEPRIFGEIIVILYVPIILGIVRQLGGHVNELSFVSEDEHQWIKNPGLNRFIYKTIFIFDKYGFAAVCVTAVISIFVFIKL